MRQLPDFVDQCGRISHAIGYAEWELHREVGRGPALPAEVNQELLSRGGLLDRNILEEQPQHPLAVFGLGGRGMPHLR